MQEPDSFSQGLDSLLEFTHAGCQPGDLRLLRGAFTGALPLDAGALLWWGHHSTFSRDQSTVEITVEHRRPPPPEPVIRDSLLLKPERLLSIRLDLVPMHELTDLLRREPRTDRQTRQLPH